MPGPETHHPRAGTHGMHLGRSWDTEVQPALRREHGSCINRQEVSSETTASTGANSGSPSPVWDPSVDRFLTSFRTLQLCTAIWEEPPVVFFFRDAWIPGDSGGPPARPESARDRPPGPSRGPAQTSDAVIFCSAGSPEVPTLSLGPAFHAESFFDGPGAR